MKKHLPLFLGVCACLLIAAGAYVWTSRLMDSVYAYRSLLHDAPPAPGEPLGAPLTRRVVFVLIDALREDTSLKPDVMPFLNELRGRGASATIHSRPPSYSQPGYSTLLTGAWPDVSDGPTINLDYAEIPTWTQDDLVSAVQRAGRKAAVSGYYWFEKLIPQAAVDASFYTPGEDAAADRAVVDAALPWLKANDHQFVLIHIDQVDYAGHHEGGPADPRWDAAARRADDLLAEIAAALDLSKDALFVASDHGQIDRGGHGGQDPITLVEPWVLAGAGVKPGSYGDVAQVDVAPTLVALLGVNIPATTQGRTRTEMLTLTPEQTAAIERRGHRSTGRVGAELRSSHRTAGYRGAGRRGRGRDAGGDGCRTGGAPAHGASAQDPPCPGPGCGAGGAPLPAARTDRGVAAGRRRAGPGIVSPALCRAGRPDLLAQLSHQFG